jgi:hypothetical protein
MKALDCREPLSPRNLDQGEPLLSCPYPMPSRPRWLVYASEIAAWLLVAGAGYLFVWLVTAL